MHATISTQWFLKEVGEYQNSAVRYARIDKDLKNYIFLLEYVDTLGVTFHLGISFGFEMPYERVGNHIDRLKERGVLFA